MRFGASRTPAQYRSVWLQVTTTMCSGTASTVVPLGTSPFLPLFLHVLRREERLAGLRRTDEQSGRDLLLLVRGLDEIVRRRRHPSSLRFAASRGGRRPTSCATGNPWRSRETPGIEVALQVVQLELRGLADQLGRALLVVDAGQLDDDLVAALLADLRLGDAGAVDAIVDDRDRVVETGLVDRLALLGHGFLDHFEAALEVEAERRRLLERRSRQREHGNADRGPQ